MTFKNVDYCLHGAKEGGREGYREREREGRENEMESERNPHNLEREASTDHPIGKELG